ncbi:uncharacterized protein LOC132047537 [Lycium ferocissimum]|uniref:uncharacterized protein LOC132047537 n=1 Tax=Lycium ferocissimum TaxID=112874 RepID=UPI002815E7C5|nr:uncharacterized protein LOC132047537 [Lycium ferocissimum]
MEIAKALTRGTHEHGYAVLDAYRYMLRFANPRSKTTLKVDENGKFKYYFVAYKAWMLGFAQMKKVIVVDGTFLRSNYIEDTPELCIISDRHPSIKKAASIVFPTCHYDFCMRHLGENMRTAFHNGAVVSPFYKAAKAYNIDVFNDHFNQIRDLVPGAAEHLERARFHRLSRAFCPGNRYLHISVSNKYNFMTTNAVESVNSIFNVEREFSITALFDSINRRVFDLDKIPCPYAMTALRVQYGENFGRRIYDYSSPYYRVENCIIVYCEEMNPVPSEESWEVPMEILEREIPPPHVDPSKPGRRRAKRRRGIEESFATRKNKCSICKTAGHKKIYMRKLNCSIVVNLAMSCYSSVATDKFVATTDSSIATDQKLVATDYQLVATSSTAVRFVATTDPYVATDQKLLQQIINLLQLLQQLLDLSQQLAHMLQQLMHLLQQIINLLQLLQ